MTRRVCLKGNHLLYFLSVLVLCVATAGMAHGQDIDNAKLKDLFFTELSDDQIVTLLETLDGANQRTALELGAKYNWGYIPPDRTPPYSLAHWWEDLNERERRKVRIDWFRDHYQELEVDRAARELGLKDRLTKLYRRLKSGDERPTKKFSSVSFPTGELDLTQDEEPEEREDRTAIPGYTGEKPQEDEEDEEETRAKADQSKQTTTPEKKSEEPEDDEFDKVAPSEQDEKDTPETSTSADSPSGTKLNWKERMEFDGGSVIYERVGDEIKVIRRRHMNDTHLRSSPNFEFPIRDDQKKSNLGSQPPMRVKPGDESPSMRYRDRKERSRRDSSPEPR